jgi:hypothetical protein
MRAATGVLLALALALLIPPDALAAQGQVEVGFDGGVAIDGDGTDAEVLTVAFPLQSMRMGLHLGRRFSFEISAGFSRLDILDDDQNALTSFDLATYGLYHFGDDIGDVRFHLLGGLPLRYRSAPAGGGSVSDTDVGVLLGAGFTLPFADAWAMRLQAKGIGWSGSETQLAFLIGLSLLLG